MAEQRLRGQVGPWISPMSHADLEEIKEKMDKPANEERAFIQHWNRG